MEETECPRCGSFNLVLTGIQKVRVTEFWADRDLYAHEVGDYDCWVGTVHCECDTCEYKWEVEK